MKTLRLKTSKLIHDLIGEYETERSHFRWLDSATNMHHMGRGWWLDDTDDRDGWNYDRQLVETIPAPTFAEVCRILPRIGEKKKWRHQSWLVRQTTRFYAIRLLARFVDAPTEKEGMESVDKYLQNLLK